jgi:hypothetical protein
VTVEFCSWYSLADAAVAAPAAPGVYQIKQPNVIDYPTGKSAMIHYGAASDVRAALLALAERHPRGPWLARHQLATPEAGVRLLDELLARFRQRFGGEPSWPGAAR